MDRHDEKLCSSSFRRIRRLFLLTTRPDPAGKIGLPGVVGFTFVELPRPTSVYESLSSRDTLRKQPLRQRTYGAHSVDTFGPLPSVCPAVSLLLRSNAQPDSTLPCALPLDDADLLCTRRIRERQSIGKLCTFLTLFIDLFRRN